MNERQREQDQSMSCSGRGGSRYPYVRTIMSGSLVALVAGAVTVTVRKLRPPVPQQLETSGVTIRRTND